jgi:hypothetical protein
MRKTSLPSEWKFHPLKKFLNVYNRSVMELEKFWHEQARQLEWFKTWDKVIEGDMRRGYRRFSASRKVHSGQENWRAGTHEALEGLLAL